jgi:hypothetical protein
MDNFQKYQNFYSYLTKIKEKIKIGLKLENNNVTNNPVAKLMAIALT